MPFIILLQVILTSKMEWLVFEYKNIVTSRCNIHNSDMHNNGMHPPEG